MIYFECRFESRLQEIFIEVHQAYKQFDSRLKAEGFKVRVMRLFRAWEDWAVYPRDFLVRLQNTFLGLVMVSNFFPMELFKAREINFILLFVDVRLNCTYILQPDEPEMENDEDIDGAPLSDTDAEAAEDLDGVPLDGAALLKGAIKLGLTPQTGSHYDDIDGVPSEFSFFLLICKF